MKPEKNDKKLDVKVKIENNQVFEDTYVEKQKIQVLVNKTKAHFSLGDEERVLRREDGSEITDYSLTFEELGIRDGECLTYIKKSPRPPRKEGFA